MPRKNILGCFVQQQGGFRGGNGTDYRCLAIVLHRTNQKSAIYAILELFFFFVFADTVESI